MSWSTTPERETFNGSELVSREWGAEIVVRGLSSDFHDRACNSGKCWHTGGHMELRLINSVWTWRKRLYGEYKEIVRDMKADIWISPRFSPLSGSVLRLWGCLRVTSLRLQFGYWPVSAPWCCSSLWDSAQSCAFGSGLLTDWWPRRFWRRTVGEIQYLSNSSRVMGLSSLFWRTSNRWEVVLFATLNAVVLYKLRNCYISHHCSQS